MTAETENQSNIKFLLVLFGAEVQHHVTSHVSLEREALTTNVTDVALLTGVRQLVELQVLFLRSLKRDTYLYERNCNFFQFDKVNSMLFCIS